MKLVDMLSYAAIVTVLAGSVLMTVLLGGQRRRQIDECRRFREHAARILLE